MVWRASEDDNARDGNARLREAPTRQATYPAFAAWVTSADRIEGATAFADKRAPRWMGR